MRVRGRATSGPRARRAGEAREGENLLAPRARRSLAQFPRLAFRGSSFQRFPFGISRRRRRPSRPESRSRLRRVAATCFSRAALFRHDVNFQAPAILIKKLLFTVVYGALDQDFTNRIVHVVEWRDVRVASFELRNELVTVVICDLLIGHLRRWT